jgi:glycosyltransferase involved in cell wall biosynthesis
MDLGCDLLYIGRSRLHRSRANLIQTLHTVAAFADCGLRVRLMLPPWGKTASPAGLMAACGVDRPVEIVASQLLHPRFRFWPFVAWHRKTLARIPLIYTRVVDVALALARAGIACSVEIHNLDALRERGRLAALIAAHREGRVRLLVPISQSAGAELVAAGAVSERLHVAPSGFAAAAYARVPAFDAARLARPRIVHLGRLSAERGRAIFEAVVAAGAADVTIIGGGEQVAGAENLPSVAPREVAQWYGACDVVLLPYQAGIRTARTMSPIKLFEAMAAGRPIIASDLPTLREVLVDGETALLVPPAEPAAWLAALARLRADPALAARLAAGAKRAAEPYSWRRRAQGILAALARAGCAVPPAKP